MSRLRVALLILVALGSSSRAEERRIQWLADPYSQCRVWSPEAESNVEVRWLGPCPKGYATGRGVAVWYQNGKQLRRDEGDFRDGKLAGFGVRLESDGSRYEGSWRQSRAHGEGKLTTSDGNVFEGFFNNGCFKDGTSPAGIGVAAVDCAANGRTNSGP